MKSVHYVPPLVTLIIAAAWFAYLSGAKSAVKEDNALLREKIVKARNSSVSKNERARVRAKREIRPSEDEIKPSAEWVRSSRDWKKILLFLNDDLEGSFYYEVESRLEKLALEMSAEELTAAFTDMADMSISTRVRNRVEWFMLRELEKKNPAYAFGQYIAKYQAEGEVLQGVGRFSDWIARDPAAATAWYDSQLTAGTFDKSLDGKSPVLLPFEGALINSLLATAPASAEDRLNAVPPDQRGQMISQYFKSVAEKDHNAFADMLRRTMPVEQYVGLIKSKVMPFNYLNDPAAIQKDLDRIAATPEERSALLATEAGIIMDLAAARPTDPTRETFDEFRIWSQAVDPASADLATGVGFAEYLERRSKENPNITEEQNFVERLAIEYHDSGAGDAILIPLIEGSGTGNISFPKDKARALATKISDPILREELLQKLY
jgi:hypothetical protein